jgi:hypothetical protein
MNCSCCKKEIVGKYLVRPFSFGLLQEEIGISRVCPSCVPIIKATARKNKIDLQKMKIKLNAHKPHLLPPPISI